MHRYFFATANDLRDVLSRVEAGHKVVYTRMGLFEARPTEAFTRGEDLPTLEQPLGHRATILCPSYLITPAGVTVRVREVPQNAGGVRYAVDQLVNPDSIELNHGGHPEPRVLLAGRVATCTGTDVAVTLFRAYAEAIARSFTGVEGYWLGPEACALLAAGCRLTHSADSPPECDLTPEDVAAESGASGAETSTGEGLRVRKSVEETWRYLESKHARVPRHSDGRPLVPERMPNFDDEAPLGLRYFKSGLDDTDRSGLTMPRTFFGRSGFGGVRFVNTDLSESRMCWNDFDDCDFTCADLSGCDMRASIFRGCLFTGAVLRGADLRRSTFDGCDFTGADLSGAVAEGSGSRARLRHLLSEEQRAAVSWVEDAGPEPPGG